MSGVGAQVLPLPTGLGDPSIVDPLCVKLADYLAFWIRLLIGDGAVEQRPQLIPEALPPSNVFAFDPHDTWARDPALIPALYVWWPDRSASKISQISMLKWVRVRTLHIQYVHAEVQIPAGSRVYSGLTQVVDGAVAQAMIAGYHPNYDSGAPLATSLDTYGEVDLRYLGGETITALVRPRALRKDVSDNTLIQRAYPLYLGKIQVTEEISFVTPPDPETLTGITLDINVEPEDPLLVMQRTIEETP